MGNPDSASVSEERRVANACVTYLSSGHLFEARITVLALGWIEWLGTVSNRVCRGLCRISGHGLDRQGVGCVRACAVGEVKVGFVLDGMHTMPYGGAT